MGIHNVLVDIPPRTTFIPLVTRLSAPLRRTRNEFHENGGQRRVLSVTHHPFIVGMDYAFQTPELGIMCLELVTGGDLQVPEV